jgi:hypothetical protein
MPKYLMTKIVEEDLKKGTKEEDKITLVIM